MNKSTESKESQKTLLKINKKMKPKQCNYYFTSATLMMTKIERNANNELAR